MPNFGVVTPATVEARRQADAEAKARRQARQAEARERSAAEAKDKAALAKAREGLRQSLGKLLYNALKG
jgi:hypothetical protein